MVNGRGWEVGFFSGLLTDDDKTFERFARKTYKESKKRG